MPELLKAEGYSTLSSIFFHLHATQGGGEKYVVSPSRVGGLSSALLAINVYTWSNVRRRVALGCWSDGMSPTRLLEQGRRNCPCGVNGRNWVSIQHEVWDVLACGEQREAMAVPGLVASCGTGLATRDRPLLPDGGGVFEPVPAGGPVALSERCKPE